MGGWFGRNKTQVSLNNIKEIRSVPRGFGSYGDMVLILNDSSKVEMKSLPLFREKQDFIEKNESEMSKIINDVFAKLNLSTDKAEKDIGIYKSTISKMEQAKELIEELRIKDKKKEQKK